MHEAIRAMFVAEGLFGEDKKLKEEFKELVQGEWEVSQAIMRGHAIQEHMEDKYHDILKVLRRCCPEASLGCATYIM